MPILGRGCVEINIQDRTLKLQCYHYVAEQLNHGLILGADFLLENKAKILFFYSKMQFYSQ